MQFHRPLLLLLIGYWLFFPAMIEWWFLLDLAPVYTFSSWFGLITLSLFVDHRRKTQ